MFKRVAIVIIAFIIAGATLTGCTDADLNLKGNSSDTVSVPDVSDSSGYGSTYTGKQGMDMGGGLILPFDGSGIQMGFGY
jgi:hypothetical protein